MENNTTKNILWTVCVFWLLCSFASGMDSIPTKQVVNKDGGFVELLTRVFEITRYAIDSPPLPSCNKLLAEYYRRHDGPEMKKLEKTVLQASAAHTEWSNALEHPRPSLYANLTDAHFKEIVINKTSEAKLSLDKAKALVDSFKNKTVESISGRLYEVCYSEARDTASIAVEYQRTWNDRIASDKKAKVTAVNEARKAGRTIADDDDDVITDEDDVPLSTTGIQQANKASVNSASYGPAHHESFLLSSSTSWLDRAYIYFQMHVRVLMATGNAVVKDFIDFELLPAWKLVSGFWEKNYRRYTEWWDQADRRLFAARRLIFGMTTTPLSSGSDEGFDIPPVSPKGENVYFGLMPEQDKPELDEKLGKVSYAGKDREDARRERRKKLGLKAPWIWLGLTESVHVTPETSTFVGLFLAAEAIMCFAVALGMILAGVLLLTAVVLLLQVCSPFLFAYHVGYRWLFRIYLQEFFWRNFVLVVGQQAGTTLTIKSLLANISSLPAIAYYSINSDYGASAAGLIAIVVLALAAFTFSAVPMLMIVFEIIGKAAPVRTQQSLQAQRARELLAARDRAAAATVAANQSKQGGHGHSHAHGQPCGHSH